MKKTVLSFIILFFTLMSIVTAACTDSDGGKNKYELGTVTDDAKTYEDKCDSENINEYFCSTDGNAMVTVLPCVNDCEDGECQVLNQPPVSRAPAEDNISSTDLYLYGIAILIIIGLYIYWFKVKPKRKRYNR